MNRGAGSGTGARRTLVVGNVVCATFAAVSMMGVRAEAAEETTDETTEECVTRRVADGEPRAQALAACLLEAPASSVPGGGLDTSPSIPETTDDSSDGTSPALIVGVGAAGLVVGALGASLLARRSSGTGRATAGPTSSAGAAQIPPPPTTMQPTTVQPTTVQPTTVQPPPPPDRSSALVASLVDLSDRMSSQALRAEIIATLERAGVHPIEIAAGTPFEAATMHGVGGTATSDPAWVGRVATTDRCGFQDGGRVIRLPDVVVYVAG